MTLRMPVAGTERWRIGTVEVDAREHRLWRDGALVQVTPKTFALLVALLRRPGELLTKAELFDTVWAGTVVTDAALSRAIHDLRDALGDDRQSPRFIATVHGLGFRFVAPVDTAPPPAARSPGNAGAAGWLVGRDAELRRLDETLADVQGGRRRTVFISGEAGIGKTALVEGFIGRHAGDRGLWIAQGRCIEQYGTGEPHLPILEALEQLARQVRTPAFVQVFARCAPSWLAQLPWLAREADAAALKRAVADATPQRMLRELAHALDLLATQQPIVVWLEDLHWCDPSSLEAIDFMAGRRDPARLMLVGSFRPAEAGCGQAPLQRLVLTLTQRGQAQELAMQPLDAGQVAQYLARRFGDAPRVPFVALGTYIHRRTEGNALFAVTVVDDLVRRQLLRQEDGRWTLQRGIDELDDHLPDTLRRLVHDQIERLPEGDQCLIEAAAVVGASFCCAAVAAALEAEPAEVEDRCHRLARQGRLVCEQPAVTWPDGTLTSAFGFAHALYWRGVHDRIARARIAAWQLRIALRLERAYAPQSDGLATELAMRFEAAGDIDRSLHYLRVAGTAALSRCAYRVGIEHLRHGLDLVPQLRTGSGPHHELQLLLPLGAALMAAQGYASGDVEVTYQRALGLSRQCGQPADQVRALRGLWNVAFLRSDLGSARDAANELLAQAAARHDDRMAIDAHTKLGQTCLHQADLAVARSHLETALALSARTADADVMRGSPRVAAYLAWALWYGGQPAQAAVICDEALDLTRRVDSPHSSVFALGYVAWVRLMRGEVEQAHSLAERQMAISLEYGIAYWRQLAEFLQGAVMAQRGALQPSIAVMRTAIDDMQAAGGRVGISYLLCNLAEAQLGAGDVDGARRSIGEASQLIATSGNALYAAEALRIDGRIASAENPGTVGRTTAERRFEAARVVARGQGARSLELRAAIDLARLWAADGAAARAIDVLSPVLAGFQEELAGAEPALAGALLASWAGHDGTDSRS